MLHPEFYFLLITFVIPKVINSEIIFFRFALISVSMANQILAGFSKDWDPTGLVWHGKRPNAGNGKKRKTAFGKRKRLLENGPKLDRGKNGKKMAQKWKTPSKIHFWAIFLPFLPLSSLGPFSKSRFPCHASPAGSQFKDFLGIFVYVFCSPIRNDPPKTQKHVSATDPIPGQSPNLFTFMCFSFP